LRVSSSAPAIEFGLVPGEQAEPPRLAEGLRCREEQGPTSSIRGPHPTSLRGRPGLALCEGQCREPDEGEQHPGLIPDFTPQSHAFAKERSRILEVSFVQCGKSLTHELCPAAPLVTDLPEQRHTLTVQRASPRVPPLGGGQPAQRVEGERSAPRIVNG